MSPEHSILSIRNLSVAYDGVDGFLEVVSDVCVDLLNGEVFMLFQKTILANYQLMQTPVL